MNVQSGQLTLSTQHIDAIYAETGGSSAGLANAINQEHYLFQAELHNFLNRARRIGELLLVARAKVKETPSGRWLPWLEQYCPQIPERTASAYMKVAREWQVIEEKSATVADFSLRDALKSVSKPRKSKQTIQSPPTLSRGAALKLLIIDTSRQLEPFLDDDWDTETFHRFWDALGTLANLELAISRLRQRIAQGQRTNSGSNCPACGASMLAEMESCLCGWNTGHLSTRLSVHRR